MNNHGRKDGSASSKRTQVRHDNRFCVCYYITTRGKRNRSFPAIDKNRRPHGPIPNRRLAVPDRWLRQEKGVGGAKWA